MLLLSLCLFGFLNDSNRNDLEDALTSSAGPVVRFFVFLFAIKISHEKTLRVLMSN